MICPNCKHDIDDKEIARHFAARGGRATSDAKKRSSAENARKATQARMAKRKAAEEEPHE